MVGVIRRLLRMVMVEAGQAEIRKLARMTANDRAHLIRPLAPPVRGTVWGSEDIAAGNVSHEPVFILDGTRTGRIVTCAPGLGHMTAVAMGDHCPVCKEADHPTVPACGIANDCE